MPRSHDREDLKPDYRQSAHEFDILVETGQRLAETLDLQTILQAAVDGITGLAGLETAAVYLLEDEILHLWATYPPLPPGFPAELRDAPLSDHLHIKEAISGKKPFVVDDLLTAAKTDAEREVARQRRLRTVLYVPIVIDGEGIGAFLVGSTSGVVHIAENRIGLVGALANLAALTARNALLFQDTEAKTLELKASLEERLKVEKEREQLQIQLAQAQKLESIGRLAGGVAHDFNNLLQVIRGYTELAISSVPSTNPAFDYLHEVQVAADRSAGITRQLLAFARQQTIAPKVIDLSKSVDDTLQMLKRLVGENLDLVWAPDENPLPVLMDSSQLDQILTNLCINAREAIEDVGKVTIETQAARFDEEYCRLHEGYLPGDYCMLAVSDDGCGFDEEFQKNIFEPFFTNKNEGTGLGLAMVYGIVKQNEGFINVYSEPGQGTTFKIYLPLHEGTGSPALEAKKAVVHRGGGETVMIVEDDPSILTLLETVLRRQGYHVISANSPLTALDLAKRHQGEIRLLVTDVVMPDINGRELAKRIGTLFPDLLVLFMSGYTSNVIAHRGVLDEGVTFLQKPFDSPQLAEKVRSMLDGK
nr:ATP-binding protein [Candidatus Krumholzibacteria bacterium]